MTRVLAMHHTDIGDAARLVCNSRLEMGRSAPGTRLWVESILEKSLLDPSYMGFVARTEDGRSVGYLGLDDRFAIEAGGRYSQITELYVLPEHRRQGVARRLIAAGEAHSRAQNVRSVELGAPWLPEHPGAEAFYAALGYSETTGRLIKRLD